MTERSICERLRAADSNIMGETLPRNPDGPEGAAVIEAQAALLEEAWKLFNRLHKVEGLYPHTSDDVNDLLIRIEATLQRTFHGKE